MLVHDASDRLRCADYLVGCAEQHALAEMRYVSKIQREHMRVYHVTLAGTAVLWLTGTDSDTASIILTIVPTTFAIVIPTVYAYLHRND